jgi:hypothetical protein
MIMAAPLKTVHEKMKKKSPVLLLIGAAALASALTALRLLWIAGPSRSGAFLFFTVITLIVWLKIASIRRDKKERVFAAARPSLHVTPPTVAKRMQTLRTPAEKISA